MTAADKTSRILKQEGLDRLIQHLKQSHGRVRGPQARDDAIVLDDIEGVSDLPQGVIDVQAPGSYRLAKSDDGFFGFTVGPQSWKKFLHPPRQTLWQTVKQGETATIVPAPLDAEQQVFLGVRPCELAAIAIQDKVFLGDRYTDAHYGVRRAGAFIVVVNCTRAAETCFCTSMGTGPRAEAGYDIALTELGDGRILAESGTAAGGKVLAAIKADPAAADDQQAAKAVSRATAAQISRKLDTTGLPALLKNNPHAKHWDKVAARCMSCSNCTMVCPTCFCVSVEDTSNVEGTETARVRRWDSCFTTDHSYIHGGAVRPSTRSQYRQWLTHKLATWHDQFDTSGCTGCGRCITWCPVGIDLTAEAAAVRAEVEGGERPNGN